MQMPMNNMARPNVGYGMPAAPQQAGASTCGGGGAGNGGAPSCGDSAGGMCGGNGPQQSMGQAMAPGSVANQAMDNFRLQTAGPGVVKPTDSKVGTPGMPGSFTPGGWDQQQPGMAQPSVVPPSGPGPGNAGWGQQMGQQSWGGQQPINNGWNGRGQQPPLPTPGAGAPQGVNHAMDPAGFTGQNNSGNSQDAIYNAIATGNQGGLQGAGSAATNSAINANVSGGGGNSAGFQQWYQQNQQRLNQQGPMYQPGGMFYGSTPAGQAAAAAAKAQGGGLIGPGIGLQTPPGGMASGGGGGGNIMPVAGQQGLNVPQANPWAFGSR